MCFALSTAGTGAFAQAGDGNLTRATIVGRLNWLHEHDARALDGGPVQQQLDANVRAQRTRQWGSLQAMLAVDVRSTWGDGVTLTLPGLASRAGNANDMPNILDLTANVSRGSEHVVTTHIDRLAFGYTGDSWSVRAGRDAVSWGSGLVFNPLDLFSPFAPAETDRDFKSGQDMVLVQKLFDDGSDVQLLAVLRRNPGNHRDADAGSYGGKWRHQFGATEVNLLAGRHDGNLVAGLGMSLPVADAVLRFDALATRLHADAAGSRTRFTAILNTDYSLVLGDRNVYVYGELYYNGFGVTDMPATYAELPPALTSRLQRGELFTLGRRYVAVGGTLEWTARTTQSLLWLQSLEDGSHLAQTALRFDPDDHQSIEAGITWRAGRRGSEFDGSRLLAIPQTATLGGGSQAYLRWINWF
ncbi:MAG: hypothetical protein H6993_00345 [Pseudomonadales bacterium]|nr:hypothetical protein [Pseudomonadales bacterium]MCP5182372.1 hypothetical protein [Pseudomonadales bacterium]